MILISGVPSREIQLASNAAHRNETREYAERIQDDHLFHPIIIDGGRNSNLDGETHSCDPFTTRPRTSNYKLLKFS